MASSTVLTQDSLTRQAHDLESEASASAAGCIRRLNDLRWLGLDDPEDRAWARQLRHGGIDAQRLLGSIRLSAATLSEFFDGFTVEGKRRFQRAALYSPRLTTKLLAEVRESQQKRPGKYEAFRTMHGWP